MIKGGNKSVLKQASAAGTKVKAGTEVVLTVAQSHQRSAHAHPRGHGLSDGRTLGADQTQAQLHVKWRRNLGCFTILTPRMVSALALTSANTSAV